MNNFSIPDIKLSWKQKLILDVMMDEFGGTACGPELLAQCENPDLKQLSINEITWHMLRLRDAALVESVKTIYDGRSLNRYSITNFLRYGAVNIK